MSLAGGYGDLERAVVLAGHDGLPAREHVVAAPDGDELDARGGQGTVGPCLGHLAADQDAAADLDVVGRLHRPLGPLDFILLDQVRLAAGREGTDRIAFGGDRVHRESSLAVGAELGGEVAVGVLVLDKARGRDDGVRDRPAGVGGQHAALDEPRRLEREVVSLAAASPLGLTCKSCRA